MRAGIVSFEAAKLKALRKRARKIGTKILTEQPPNPQLGAGAGPYTLADIETGNPVRVPGVSLTLLELQIRRLEA